MPDADDTPRSAPESAPPAGLPILALRSGIGGLLMGLANLVPGISGGTMLVAAGIYPRFIGAIAELSVLRFRWASIVTLVSVVVAAAVAIVLFAEPVKDLVVTQRWVMYSIFIGLTLGGVPLVWKMARPATPAVWIGAAAGLALMAVLAFVQPDGAAAGGRNHFLLFFAGIAGASAMILPGVSGAYLLLILGQYIPILASIERGKAAAMSGDWAVAAAELHTYIPVGLGVVIGVVGVSNLIKVLLARFPQPTLGVLLGLLVGAVLGLYPFQRPTEPAVGDVLRGSPVTLVETRADDRGGERLIATTQAGEVEIEDWPTEYFRPTPVQAVSALGLVAAGFGATVTIGLLGRGREENARNGGGA